MSKMSYLSVQENGKSIKVDPVQKSNRLILDMSIISQNLATVTLCYCHKICHSRLRYHTDTQTVDAWYHSTSATLLAHPGNKTAVLKRHACGRVRTVCSV